MRINETIVLREYSKIMNAYSSGYRPKDEDIAAKIASCIDLMGKYDIEIFKNACANWIDNEDRMPSPTDLRKKCREIYNETIKLQAGKMGIVNAVCGFEKVRKPNGWLECETSQGMCGRDTFNQGHYDRSISYYGYYVCEWHDALHKHLTGNLYRGSEASWLGDPNVAWTHSELMARKYQLADDKTRLLILSTLTDAQRSHVAMVESALSKLKNPNYEECLNEALKLNRISTPGG